jgi:hypothetical protein
MAQLLSTQNERLMGWPLGRLTYSSDLQKRPTDQRLGSVGRFCRPGEAHLGDISAKRLLSFVLL